MRPKSVLLFLFALTLAPIASTQTKISGTLKCGKPDPSYSISVGDQPGHVFSMIKNKCTWQGTEIAGMQTKDHEYVAFGNIRGGRAQGQSDAVGTVSNGDKYFSSSQGTATLKEGGGMEKEGTWSFTGGTGKLQGIKGEGTYKGHVGADGTETVEVEGAYLLPPTS